MYVHPFVAILGLVVAGLAGGAIAFIWTSAGISRCRKVEHSILALAYAASLVIFVTGMFESHHARWALPVAVMVMGSGTAWANWRAGVTFWLVFGLMTLLGGISMLVMENCIRTLSLKVFLALNLPWMVLLVWLLYMLLRRTWGGAAGKSHES